MLDSEMRTFKPDMRVRANQRATGPAELTAADPLEAGQCS